MVDAFGSRELIYLEGVRVHIFTGLSEKKCVIVRGDQRKIRLQIARELYSRIGLTLLVI